MTFPLSRKLVMVAYPYVLLSFEVSGLTCLRSFPRLALRLLSIVSRSSAPHQRSGLSPEHSPRYFLLTGIYQRTNPSIHARYWRNAHTLEKKFSFLSSIP